MNICPRSNDSTWKGRSARRGQVYAGLAPVVEEVDAGAVVAGLVVALHDDGVHLGAEATGEHLAIRLVVRCVDAGGELCEAATDGEGSAGGEEGVEALLRVRAGAGGAELDVAGAAASFAPCAAVAGGEGEQFGVVLRVPDEDGVAEALRLDGLDFGAEVEAVVDAGGEVAAGGEGGLRWSSERAE